MHRSILSRTAVFAIAAGVSLAAAPAGSAATVTGFTSLTPEGTAASGLKRQKVTTLAVAPVQLVNKRLIVPGATATVSASAATVEHTGGFTLRRKAGGKVRLAKVTGLRLELGKKDRVVSAKVGGKRVDLFTLDLRKNEYNATAASSSVVIEGTRASLTKAAAKAIATKLGLASVKSGLFGVLETNVGVVAATTAPGASTAPGTTTTPGSTTAPSSTTAPGGTPIPTPETGATVFPDPGTLARPASAVDLTTASITWQVRETFVAYINTESEPVASGGATPGPKEPRAAGNGVPLVYSYGFTPAGGWYDAASGKARVLFKGKVTFTFAAHGIDFDVIDPEVEINAGESRVVATFGGRRNTRYAGRSVLIDLKTAGLSPTASGTTQTYSSIPGLVPAAASKSVFAGFYSPGDAFGSIALSFTTAS